MKRYIVLIALGIFNITAYSQNEYEIKKGIESSVKNFFSLLSYINDDEEPIKASTLASDFRGEHYFRLNGTEMTLEHFLSNYSRSDLRNNFVNHSIKINTNSIKKLSSSTSDRRWSVRATLLRENATDEDYYIKDEDITIVVRWNGSDKDVSILDLTFSTPLQIVRPVTNREYKFEVDRRNSTLRVPYSGGDWKIAVNSWYRDVKSYPGIPDKTTTGDWYLASFDGRSLDNIKFEKSDNTNPQYLSGTLRGNYSKAEKVYSFKLAQLLSGKNFMESITQEKKKLIKWYDFECPMGFHHVDLIYSLKYNLGLSYMYTLEDTRFSIGALLAMNFDKFRGMKNWLKTEVTQTQTIVIGGENNNTMNGYTITTETINPDKTNYSSLMDPKNEAKHYTSRSLYLVQGGFNISQWAEFDLGLGAARARDLYFMDSAYSLEIYKYEKSNSNLPDIDDVYVYRNKYKDYYYKDPAKWGFAVRPALKFQIPLDSSNESFLSLGVGYTYVTSIKDASSLDFTIGIRWE